jgi:hypothetical protein
MRLLRAVLPLFALTLLACPPDPPQATGPKADTECPKELGTTCKVLKDETEKLTDEYHVLVPPETKHEDAEKYLQVLYRHLMTRRDATPTQIAETLDISSRTVRRDWNLARAWLYRELSRT